MQHELLQDSPGVVVECLGSVDVEVLPVGPDGSVGPVCSGVAVVISVLRLVEAVEPCGSVIPAEEEPLALVVPVLLVIPVLPVWPVGSVGPVCSGVERVDPGGPGGFVLPDELVEPVFPVVVVV